MCSAVHRVILVLHRKTFGICIGYVCHSPFLSGEALGEITGQWQWDHVVCFPTCPAPPVQIRVSLVAEKGDVNAAFSILHLYGEEKNPLKFAI